MTDLSGLVHDVNGAAIPNANIFLFDQARKLVERLRSDRAGKFALHHSLSGTYGMVVSAPGFSHFRGNAEFKPMGDTAGRSSLKVRLGLAGDCSTAESRQPVFADLSEVAPFDEKYEPGVLTSERGDAYESIR